MTESFFILKPKHEDGLSRAVAFAGDSAEELTCDKGFWNFNELSLCSVNKCLRKIIRLHKQEKFEMSKDEPIHLQTSLIKLADFFMDELSSDEVTSALSEHAESSMGAWIDSGINSYFEFTIRSQANEPSKIASCLKHLTLGALKTFKGDLQLTLVYFNSSFFVTLEDASTDENELFLRSFPNISTRSAGVQIKTYKDCIFPINKLTLWNASSALNDLLLSLQKSPQSGESGSKHGYESEMVELDDIELILNAKQSFKGAYNQAYFISDPLPVETSLEQEHQSFRRAMFRYGDWCYEGQINLQKRFELPDVPLILRQFQRQQGKLKFTYETKKLPINHHFQLQMASLEVACSLLKKYILKSERVLEKLEEMQLKRNLPPWVNVDNGKQYFELQVSRSYLKEHFHDVSFVATKIYYHEVVFIVLLVRETESFFVTLNPIKGDQPLLDLSFPDVSSKNRGYMLYTFKHPDFKKLTIWECERSVWETSNNMVIQQRTKMIEDKVQLVVEDSPKEEDKVLEGNKLKETKPQRVKKAESERKVEEEKSSAAEAKVSLTRQSSAARAPHHVKAIDMGLRHKTLSTLPQLNDEAPWDEFGRPKKFFSKEHKHNN